MLFACHKLINHFECFDWFSQIARRLLGKILIDLRNTREEAISVSDPKFTEDEATFLPTKESEYQQKLQTRNEDGRRSSSTSEKSLDQEDEDDRETKYRLDPKYALGFINPNQS